MPIVSLNKLGRSGFFGDIASYEIPLDGWSDALNVRTRNGSIKNAVGHTRIHEGVVVPPFYLQTFNELGTRTLIYAGENKIYKTVGQVHTNITRQTDAVDVDYTAEMGHWNGGVLGGIPILNNGFDLPQSYDYATGKMQDLPAWPTSWRCRTMRVIREYLFALDITKDTTRFPQLLAWSNPADSGTVPSSWDATDPANDAGDFAIVGGGDAVVDIVPLKDFAVLYKENSMHLVQFIGQPFIWSFKPISFGRGVLNINCVVEVKGGHFVVTNEDIIWHNGYTYEQVAKGKVQNWVFRNININATDKAYVAHDTSEQKVWFCFPSGSSTVPDLAIVWDYEENTWIPIGIPASAHMLYTESSDASSESLAWNQDTGTWNDDPGLWGSATFRNLNYELLSARAEPLDPKILSMSREWTIEGDFKPCYVERVGLPIAGQDRRTGEPTIDLDSVKFVRTVWPKLRCTPGKAVKIRIGMQWVPDGPVTWGPLQTFDPREQNKLNVLMSGRFLCFRLESYDDMYWELDGYDLDLDLIGVY